MLRKIRDERHDFFPWGHNICCNATHFVSYILALCCAFFLGVRCYVRIFFSFFFYFYFYFYFYFIILFILFYFFDGANLLKNMG